MKTAIIGWGSLLWDDRPEYDNYHGPWYFDGPVLRLEFTRISVARKKALTLVLEEELGAQCRVAYTVSKRDSPAKAIEDLQEREKASAKEVGVYLPHDDPEGLSQANVPLAITQWADQTDFDAVIWTGLPNNFTELSGQGKSFSHASAIDHIQSLCPVGQWKSAEYIFRAPEFIRTPLRSELESLDWFIRLWEEGRDSPPS